MRYCGVTLKRRKTDEVRQLHSPRHYGRGAGHHSPIGNGAALRHSAQRVPAIGGVRLVRQTMGQVTGLPDATPDTILIVSGMVLSALNGARQDVVAPDTGADAIRENGQIVAVNGFVC